MGRWRWGSVGIECGLSCQRVRPGLPAGSRHVGGANMGFPRLLRLLRLPPSRDHLMGGKKKSSLQTALLNQQSRLKQKAQIAQAAKSNEKAKAAKKQTGKKRTTTIPFAPTDKILLIGEGNFSFAHALVIDPPSQLQHLPPQNVTATAYDSEEECLRKYPDVREKIDALRTRGINVLFGVDATKLEKVSQLKGKRWDKVVWNFPHAGMCASSCSGSQSGQPTDTLYRKGNRRSG